MNDPQTREQTTQPPQGSRRPKKTERGSVDTRPILRRIRAAATLPYDPTSDKPDEGQSWDALYSTLCAHPLMRRSDVRYECERVIAEEVAMTPDERPWTTYFVDAGGMLRQRPDVQQVPDAAKDEPHDPHELETFLENRVIGERSGNLYWFDPIDRTFKKFESTCETTGRPKYGRVRRTFYRQGKLLTPDEVETFSEFPAKIRRKVLALAPTDDTGALAK